MGGTDRGAAHAQLWNVGTITDDNLIGFAGRCQQARRQVDHPIEEGPRDEVLGGSGTYFAFISRLVRCAIDMMAYQAYLTFDV